MANANHYRVDSSAVCEGLIICDIVIAKRDYFRNEIFNTVGNLFYIFTFFFAQSLITFAARKQSNEHMSLFHCIVSSNNYCVAYTMRLQTQNTHVCMTIVYWITSLVLPDGPCNHR